MTGEVDGAEVIGESLGDEVGGGEGAAVGMSEGA